MELRFKVYNAGLVALMCFAVMAITQPVSAQDDATPEELALEAARLATAQLDDAAEIPLDSGEFVMVDEAPKIGPAPEGVVVDMRTIPPSAISAESYDHPQSHIQGELDYDVFGSSTVPPVINPRQDTPESFLTEPQQEGGSNTEVGTPGTLVTNWSARDYTGWIPPDTQMAVGPEYIVEAVNSGFVVYTKTGLQTRAYTTFTSFVNLPTVWDGFCYDPRVVFDSYSDRFLMMIMGKDTTNLKAYYWLMVSQTSDPNGAWWIWRVDASAGAAGSEEWLDYAAIGVDYWGVYVTGNYFAFGGGYQRTQLWSWGPSFMTGTSTNYYYWGDLNWPVGSNAKTVQPAMPLSTNAAGNTFYVNSWNGSGSELCLWTQTGKRWPGSTDPDSAGLSRAVIPSKTYYSMGNNIDQPGSIWDIDGGDASVRNAVYNNGRVAITLALNWDNNRLYSEVYLAVLSTAGTMDYDRAIWNSNYYMNYPAVTMQPGSSADVGLTFSMTEPSVPTGFIGVLGYGYDPTGDTTLYFSWHRGGDGPYSRWDGDFEGDGRNRWGDYSAASWDWTCQNAWFAAEYATASNSWDTQIFARTLGTYDPCKYFHVKTPNGGQSITAGSSYSVTWDRMNIPSTDSVLIDYWNGSTWVNQATVAYNATSYSWSVPNTPTTVAKIRVRNSSTGNQVNDTTDGTFTIVGLPDLVPSLLSPEPSYSSGLTYSVYNSVRNQGPVPAGGFDVELRLSINNICSNLDTLVGTRRVSSLGPGGLNTTSTSMTVPLGMSGPYYLCQLIDPGGEVAEFVEGNNSTYAAVSIVATLFADGFESGNTSAWATTAP